MSLFRALALPLLALLLTGCASLASDRMTGHLKTVMLAQDDPETVRAAAPAFLLLVESMIAESPEDPRLLATGAELAASYGALLDDPDRRARLADRAYDYAKRALCAEQAPVCDALNGPFENFSAAVAKVGPAGLENLYLFRYRLGNLAGVSWRRHGRHCQFAQAGIALQPHPQPGPWLPGRPRPPLCGSPRHPPSTGSGWTAG
jgi:hypothetical protein